MNIALDNPQTKPLDQLCINTIRTLAMDGVQKANSGHPGAPMGLAPVAYWLWDKFLRHNPENPHWANRDRFVLSGGHGSMLLYSLLHLTGYDLPLSELQNFRQWNSKTPGHPEYGMTPGVETTTGPLGQGFTNSVGMAIAERWLAARYGSELVDYRTYSIGGDGDMMEGIASEAASLAGHLGLHKLTWIYDNNKITIEGHTRLAFSEDVALRFKAYGWYVQHVTDVNDLQAVNRALKKAQKQTEKPALIIVDSHIGFGAPTKQDTHGAHGEPLGDDEIVKTKARYGWPTDAKFLVPEEAGNHFRRRSAGVASWKKNGRRNSMPSPKPTRPSPLSGTRCKTASSPPAGTKTFPSSRPTRKVSRPGNPMAKSSTLSPRMFRGCSAAPLTSRPRPRR